MEIMYSAAKIEHKSKPGTVNSKDGAQLQTMYLNSKDEAQLEARQVQSIAKMKHSCRSGTVNRKK